MSTHDHFPKSQLIRSGSIRLFRGGGRKLITIAVLLAISLAVATFWFHSRALRLIALLVPRISLNQQGRVLPIVLMIFVAHLVEVSFYALGYWVSVDSLKLGTFGGNTVVTFLDYLYFSSVTYTSLGLGDVFPEGHLRFITGVEALNGLMLITWSASFTYLAMGRLWPWASCDAPNVKSTCQT